ncbi:MAG: primase C-terminal domain-containing protein [Thermoplasmata archaeon]|nr:primase C-terminal domain-containing protein [Thermoplasmata archaeon]
MDRGIPMTFVLPEVIVEGRRNDQLLRYGGVLRRHGAQEIEIRGRLLEANAARCVPPLSDREVAGIARSVARYEPLGDAGWVPGSVYAAPAEASLRRRGVRLAESGAVHRVSAFLFDVTGRRGGRFRVDLSADGGACQCGRFLSPRGQRCAHVFAVRWYVRMNYLPLEGGNILTQR